MLEIIKGKMEEDEETCDDRAAIWIIGRKESPKVVQNFNNL